MFSPATVPVWQAIFPRFTVDNMDNSPDRNTSPFVPHTSGGRANERRSNRLEVPETPPSRASSPTQYAFITSTGDESAAVARQKLKTVRSHVMKNYLQQQQRQGQSSGESLLPQANTERRKGKQRARSSRSNSREQEHIPASPAVSERSSQMAEMSTLFSGFSLANFSGDQQINPGY